MRKGGQELKAAPLLFQNSMSSLFAPARRLVKGNVEQEKSGPSGQARSRGAHRVRQHRVGAPGVELPVVDHLELEKRERKGRNDFFLFFEGLRE